MESARASRPRRILSALFAALLLSGFAALGAAAPASAHDQLVSTDPAADAVLDALPEQLTLTFSAELLDGGGNEVIVTDAEGTSLTDGTAVVDGTNLVQTLTGEASGAVTVLWRAVSSDGHPISGEYAFSVNAAPSPSSTATETAEPTTSATPTAEPTSSASPTDAPAEDAEGTASPLPWIILGVVVAAALGAVVFLLVSRARRAGGSGPEAGSGDGAGR